MTLIELLDRLGDANVRIWVEGGRLRVRAPAGALTDELRSALDAHKTALVAQLQAPTDRDRPPLERVLRTAPLPLSFAQQRLWFLAELEPASAAYNIPAAIRMTGPLKPEILARAANEIVRRHEVLRTTFRNERGQPVLVLHDAMPIEVPVVDLSGEREADQPALVMRAGADQTRQLFDLGRGPLLRVSLLRLAADDHVLLFTIHHLVSDGWSSRVFMRELAVLYDAFASGRRSPLPDLGVQYLDFAAWERRWLTGDVLARELAYWRTRLEALPTVALPSDRPRPRIQTFEGASMQRVLPADLGERLNRLAREEGATLFPVLLAAFAALVGAMTGATDVPIGSPVANRSRRELEDLVGLFVNTVVLRIDLSGRPTFRELVRRVRDVAFEAHAHQDLPFEKLVAEMQPARDLSRHALFQVVFVLQDNPVEREEIRGLTLRQMPIDSWHVKFDLVVNMWDSQEGLVVWCEYNSGLFEPETVSSLVERFHRVLASVVAAPDARVDGLEILSPEELELLAIEPSFPALDRDFAFGADGPA